jgi:hypothetical protein
MFQTLGMLGIFAVLAVPLFFTLRQIAWEATAQRQARDVVSAEFGDNSRVSQLEIDYATEPLRVTATVLTPTYIAQAEQEVSGMLAKAFNRPVDVQIEQFRVGVGDAEATQVARAQANEQATREARTVTRLAEQLALVAGVPSEAVLLDRGNRRAVVSASALPGASLASYRALEQRVGTAAQGWSVELVPPAVAPATISFGDDGPDADGQRNLQTAIWAGQRLRLPLGVSGTADNADAVVAALTEAGIAAERLPGGGPVTLRWLAPTVEGGN